MTQHATPATGEDCTSCSLTQLSLPVVDLAAPDPTVAKQVLLKAAFPLCLRARFLSLNAAGRPVDVQSMLEPSSSGITLWTVKACEVCRCIGLVSIMDSFIV
jgi:hypothetical protein